MNSGADLPPPIARRRTGNWIMLAVAGAFAVFTLFAGVSMLGDKAAWRRGAGDYAFFAFTALGLAVVAWQAAQIRDTRPALEFIPDGAAIYHFPGASRQIRWAELVSIDVRQASKGQREIVFTSRRDTNSPAEHTFHEKVVLSGARVDGDPDLIAARLDGLVGRGAS